MANNNGSMIYKSYEILELNSNKDTKTHFTFTGYASNNNIDYSGDVIIKDAWDLDVISKKKFPLLYNHLKYGPELPIGTIKVLGYDDNGLKVEGRIPKKDPRAESYMAQIEEGSISKMSVGGFGLKSRWDEETGIRYITEFELREISLVIFPANEEASIVSFKNDAFNFLNLKIAEKDYEWDECLAVNRWRNFTKSFERPSEFYGKGFLSYCSKNMNGFECYKYLMLDIIDNKPCIIPQRVKQIKKSLLENKSELEKEDLIKNVNILNKYLKICDLDPIENIEEINKSLEDKYKEKIKTISDISDILKEKGFSNKESNIFISNFKKIVKEESDRNCLTSKNNIDSNYQASFNDINWNEVIHGLKK